MVMVSQNISLIVWVQMNSNKKSIRGTILPHDDQLVKQKVSFTCFDRFLILLPVVLLTWVPDKNT